MTGDYCHQSDLKGIAAAPFLNLECEKINACYFTFNTIETGCELLFFLFSRILRNNKRKINPKPVSNGHNYAYRPWNCLKFTIISYLVFEIPFHVLVRYFHEQGHLKAYS